MRYFIEIAYNGKNYFGWQRQPKQISIQQVLEDSLSTFLRKELKITGAGRTDTGVHAKQLMAHFDHDQIEDVERLIFRMNSFLPPDIAIKNLFEVPSDAHARFDALERTYEYKVGIGKDPFSQDYAYQVYKKPDIALMNQAAELLLHHKNFQCFSRSKTDVKTYNCKVKEAYWEERDENLIFTITADRFLRNMVRAIVGTLLDVGYAKSTLEDFKAILMSRSRDEAGPSAPAKALYLLKIVYPETIISDPGSRQGIGLQSQLNKCQGAQNPMGISNENE